MRWRRALSAAVLAATAIATWPRGADALVLSVRLNGTTVGNGVYSRFDAVWLDPVSNTSRLLLDNSLFGQETRLDAFQLLPDDRVVFTIAPATRSLGGLTFTDGDVVLYDPVADTATLLLDESGFQNDAEVDAVQLLPNGHLLLSTESSETLYGVAFEDGDVVDYDPATNGVTLVFDEDLFAGNEDLDALWLGSDGSVYLSTRNAGTLAGLSFEANDVVRWSPTTGTATLAFDGASGMPADTVLISGFLREPGALALASGLGGLALFPAISRRRARGAGR